MALTFRSSNFKIYLNLLQSKNLAISQLFEQKSLFSSLWIIDINDIFSADSSNQYNINLTISNYPFITYRYLIPELQFILILNRMDERKVMQKLFLKRDFSIFRVSLSLACLYQIYSVFKLYNDVFVLLTVWVSIVNVRLSVYFLDDTITNKQSGVFSNIIIKAKRLGRF